MIKTNYLPLKSLGRGTYGNVYLVRNSLTGEKLVMKVIDVRNLSDTQKEKTLREVDFLKRFDHSFIVAYKESFMQGNKFCIVMDYCDGGDLYREIEERKKTKMLIEEKLILRWLVQIIIGLREIHKRKCLHRDLKPHNVLLDKQGRARIADFGVSTDLNSTLGQAHSIIGTPYYFSPELSRGEPYCWPSDIWALGCLTYELLTLFPPFYAAKNLKELTQLIKTMQIPNIPKCYSLELQALVSKMLTRDANSRVTCDELLKNKKIQSTLREMLLENNTVAQHLLKSIQSDLNLYTLVGPVIKSLEATLANDNANMLESRNSNTHREKNKATCVISYM